MQMNMKRATIIFIVFMAIIGIAYAVDTIIYSPIVSETVTEYTATLTALPSSPIVHTILSLRGTLSLAGTPVGIGKTVYLERNINSAGWLEIQSTTTAADGTYQFEVERTATGLIEYRVRFDY